MLVAIFHVLKDGVAFRDLGAEYYNQFNKERKINAYLPKRVVIGEVFALFGYPEGWVSQ